MSAAVTLLGNKDSGGLLTKPTPTLLAIIALLTLTGYAVFVILRWYRAWKVHYMNTLKEITTYWKISDNLLPYWMKGSIPIDDMRRSNWSVDDTFLYFIGLLNVALAALTAHMAVYLARGGAQDLIWWCAVVLSSAIYFVLLLLTYQRMFSATKYLRA